MIKLIVDSTCDLDETFIKKHNIDVIPLQVLINGISYKDKLEIELETLYKHIRQGDDIKTSLPSYDDMFPLFENYAKTNQPFIFFSFAKALSGTYNFASILVEELKTKYDTPMAVIDLKNGGLGSTLLIEEIVRFTQKNYNFDDVVNFSDNLTSHMKHLIMLEDVSQLRKGGRDRKSTRLNSSHVRISYAVFCLKKKTWRASRPLKPSSPRYWWQKQTWSLVKERLPNGVGIFFSWLNICGNGRGRFVLCSSQ